MESNEYLKSILQTTLAWLIPLFLFSFLRTYGIEDTFDFKRIRPLNYEVSFTMTILATLVLGFLFGTLDYLANLPAIRNRSFGLILLFKTVSHLVIVIITVLIFGHIYTALYGYRIGVDIDAVSFLRGKPFTVFLIYTAVVSIVISLIKQVNKKFGPGVLYKLLIGKYHKPVEEERIFMFLDLKDSTSSAENLGHIRYSQLIQSCFADITETIATTKAEVYQYVGDEIILTWDLKNGLENQNCIKAFFHFHNILQTKGERYTEKFGFIPQFKCGINIGKVTLAEVGIIKREIAYHGDVLNTAARIQGKCNELKKPILISEALNNALSTENNFRTEAEGSVPLKGKKKAVAIYSVNSAEATLVL